MSKSASELSSFVFTDDVDSPEQKGRRALLYVPDVTSPAELFDFFNASLDLPEHFGRNWDALYDCLVSRDAPAGPIVLRHERLPLRDHADCATYLALLQDIVIEVPRGYVVSFSSALKDRVTALLAADRSA